MVSGLISCLCFKLAALFRGGIPVRTVRTLRGRSARMHKSRDPPQWFRPSNAFALSDGRQ